MDIKIQDRLDNFSLYLDDFYKDSSKNDKVIDPPKELSFVNLHSITLPPPPEVVDELIEEEYVNDTDNELDSKESISDVLDITKRILKLQDSITKILEDQNDIKSNSRYDYNIINNQTYIYNKPFSDILPNESNETESNRVVAPQIEKMLVEKFYYTTDKIPQSKSDEFSKILYQTNYLENISNGSFIKSRTNLLNEFNSIQNILKQDQTTTNNSSVSKVNESILVRLINQNLIGLDSTMLDNTNYLKKITIDPPPKTNPNSVKFDSTVEYQKLVRQIENQTFDQLILNNSSNVSRLLNESKIVKNLFDDSFQKNYTETFKVDSQSSNVIKSLFDDSFQKNYLETFKVDSQSSNVIKNLFDDSFQKNYSEIVEKVNNNRNLLESFQKSTIDYVMSSQYLDKINLPTNSINVLPNLNFKETLDNKTSKLKSVIDLKSFLEKTELSNVTNIQKDFTNNYSNVERLNKSNISQIDILSKLIQNINQIEKINLFEKIQDSKSLTLKDYVKNDTNSELIKISEKFSDINRINLINSFIDIKNQEGEDLKEIEPKLTKILTTSNEIERSLINTRIEKDYKTNFDYYKFVEKTKDQFSNRFERIINNSMYIPQNRSSKIDNNFSDYSMNSISENNPLVNNFNTESKNNFNNFSDNNSKKMIEFRNSIINNFDTNNIGSKEQIYESIKIFDKSQITNQFDKYSDTKTLNGNEKSKPNSISINNGSNIYSIKNVPSLDIYIDSQSGSNDLLNKTESYQTVDNQYTNSNYNYNNLLSSKNLVNSNKIKYGDRTNNTKNRNSSNNYVNEVLVSPNSIDTINKFINTSYTEGSQILTDRNNTQYQQNSTSIFNRTQPNIEFEKFLVTNKNVNPSMVLSMFDKNQFNTLVESIEKNSKILSDNFNNDKKYKTENVSQNSSFNIVNNQKNEKSSSDEKFIELFKSLDEKLGIMIYSLGNISSWVNENRTTNISIKSSKHY